MTVFEFREWFEGLIPMWVVFVPIGIMVAILFWKKWREE